MIEAAAAAVTNGSLLSDSVVSHPLFPVLAAFVAINTVMYAALSVAKVMPKVYFADLIRGRSRRSETRSIHPDE